MDGSPNMIEQARSRSGDSTRSFEFRFVRTIEDIDEAEQSFDGILCSSVLEYLDRPNEALSEFARLLKPGGVVLVSVANRYSVVRTIQTGLRFVAKAIRVSAFDYLDVSRSAFSRSEIVAALQAHGFQVTGTEAFDPVLPRWLRASLPAALLFIAARRRDTPTG